MYILHKRDTTLNERLIQPATFNEALLTLAGDAAIPSRKYKVFRVRFNGRPLFLSKNREIFRTRAAARTAMKNWLYYGLQDVLGSANLPGINRNDAYRELARRLGRDPIRWADNSVYSLVDAHMKNWEKDGILVYEVVNMDPADQAVPPEAIRA